MSSASSKIGAVEKAAQYCAMLCFYRYPQDRIDMRGEDEPAILKYCRYLEEDNSRRPDDCKLNSAVIEKIKEEASDVDSLNSEFIFPFKTPPPFGGDLQEESSLLPNSDASREERKGSGLIWFRRSSKNCPKFPRKISLSSAFIVTLNRIGVGWMNFAIPTLHKL